MFPRRLIRSAVGTALVALAGAASAAVVQLDFEGLKDLEAVQGFYNGGTGSLGSSGANYGVSFNGATLALIDADAGGSGNFANEPTPSTVMFFQDTTAILNYAAGFGTGFSFWYTTLGFAGTVTVWDDVGGTGSLLGTINIAALGSGCLGDPAGSFCNWAVGAVTFSGTAKSINFGGTAAQVGYDNITLGSPDPTSNGVPEPATLALTGLALLGLAAQRRRRNA